jgi:hypothetical protein
VLLDEGMIFFVKVKVKVRIADSDSAAKSAAVQCEEVNILVLVSLDST